MKRILLILVQLCLLAGIVSATDIRRIETEVWLYRSGNAVVAQTWDVNITQGTEWYIPIENLGQRIIRNFKVFENDKEYANEGNEWNSDRSLEAKTRRCGIVEKSNGVELCWGQGEYGDHVYQILYIIDNLIQQMADTVNVGFNWQFINDELAANPDSVRMVIHCPVDSTTVWQAGDGGNMGVWAFGCEADVRVEDGTVTIESTEPFGYHDYLTVLMRFDADPFVVRTRDYRTFEQVQREAFLGSDYFDYEPEEPKPFWEALWDLIKTLGEILLVITLVPFTLLALPVLLWRWSKRLFLNVTGLRYEKEVFGTHHFPGWYRDVPLEGRLDAAFALLQVGDKLCKKDKLFSQLIGAYFLRWVQRGWVVSVNDPKNENRVNLRFTATIPAETDFVEPVEAKLYAAARKAAGVNSVLETDEFKSWSTSNYLTVTGWSVEALKCGNAVWKEHDKEERCNLMRFKRFLSQFTLSEIRTVPEVALWEEYLVFAQLFGIADRVSKSLNKLYPKQFANYTPEVIHSIGSASVSFYNAARSKKSSVEASRYRSSGSSSSTSSHTRYSGGGGHSSHRGGGGHHGGGHGGGSR